MAMLRPALARFPGLYRATAAVLSGYRGNATARLPGASSRPLAVRSYSAGAGGQMVGTAAPAHIYEVRNYLFGADEAQFATYRT